MLAVLLRAVLETSHGTLLFRVKEVCILYTVVYISAQPHSHRSLSTIYNIIDLHLHGHHGAFDFRGGGAREEEDVFSVSDRDTVAVTLLDLHRVHIVTYHLLY
jgi:hypothetical protein